MKFGWRESFLLTLPSNRRDTTGHSTYTNTSTHARDTHTHTRTSRSQPAHQAPVPLATSRIWMPTPGRRAPSEPKVDSPGALLGGQHAEDTDTHPRNQHTCGCRHTCRHAPHRHKPRPHRMRLTATVSGQRATSAVRAPAGSRRGVPQPASRRSQSKKKKRRAGPSHPRAHVHLNSTTRVDVSRQGLLDKLASTGGT